jgi:transcriptional regulator with GAF, ATPase, and Fis domain
MAAKLIAIAGPFKGTTFPVKYAECVVGRDASSGLCLEDEAVSRRHCVILSEAGTIRIRDLESRNGTMVNHAPITERALESGDQLKIGESTFLFSTADAAPIAPREGTPDIETQTLVLHSSNCAYLHTGGIAGAGRAARDLAALLRISCEISKLREPEAIARQLAEIAAGLIQGARAELVLLDRDSPRGGAAARAVEESAAVLEDNRVLVVPLVSGSRPLALLRLEAGDRPFDDGHLHFMSAVGAIASLALENATHIEYLEGENRRLRDESNLKHQMAGEGPRMQEILKVIAKAAPSNATVLIQGESGTGKELAARAIHNNSGRAAKPFVAINCATLQENLLESELFGHEKGAFTGAVIQKRGKIELAEGGTLFLDEIGEMPPLVQSKLLRVLQEREYERLGGTRTLRADIRVLAATNRDLMQAVRAGGFRQDLYYRLNVVTITLPPLRERREDIPLLANTFASRFAGRAGRAIQGISPAARACLVQYDWPGNIRELENAIERAVVLGSSGLIEPDDLPEAILEAAPSQSSAAGYHELVRDGKRKIIQGALERGGGSQLEAARQLGLNPTYLSRLMRNLNLKT